MPAAAAIDWTDLGVRIGDRAELGMRDLAASTLRRIGMGLEMISDPALIAAAGNTYDAASGSGNRYLRATDPMGWPMPAQVTTAQQALVSGGFTTPVGGTWRTDADRLDAPMKTRTTSDTDALILTQKFVMAVNHDSGPRAFNPDQRPLPTRSTKNGEALVMAEPFVAMLRNHVNPTRIDQPLMTIAAGGFHHGLVVPFRKGARPHSPSEPLSTMATHAQHGIMAAERDINIADCYFRMLSPRESANAQRFARDYILTGTLGEQQLGAGNAVAVNVAQMIGTRVAEGLDAA
jgi:DNA (cytosine-5)-methyltransferase 1